MRRAIANLVSLSLQLVQIPGTQVWAGGIGRGDLPRGIHPLSVTIEDSAGRTAADSIRIVVWAAAYFSPERTKLDQDNALSPWPERRLLATQLGPNKNRRKSHYLWTKVGGQVTLTARKHNGGVIVEEHNSGLWN